MAIKDTTNLTTYGIRVFLKEESTPIDLKCLYDGWNPPFYSFIMEDKSQFLIPLESIKYLDCSIERGLQIEYRRTLELNQENN